MVTCAQHVPTILSGVGKTFQDVPWLDDMCSGALCLTPVCLNLTEAAIKNQQVWAKLPWRVSSAEGKRLETAAASAAGVAPVAP